MSLSSSTDYPSPRTRTRQKPAVKIDMPAAVKGKFYAALKRGTSYHLASIDRTFNKGEVIEVSEEVYLHLSEAHDITSYTDPDMGRVRRKLRKFVFSPALPDELEVSYPDLHEIT